MSGLRIVAEQVGVLFALIGVGAACRKARLLDESAVTGIVNVLILIVTPCLIVDVFQRPFDAGMLAGLGIAFVVALVAHLAAILLASAGIRTGADGTRCVLRVATVFSNAGFMGIPLEQAILGEKGVFFGIVYVAVFNLLIWSWGLAAMRGTFRINRMMFVNPGTVGLALGLPLFFLSARLPDVLHAPVGMLAALNTPLAMLVIGYYLAGAKLGPVLRAPVAWSAAAFRLVVLPLFVLAVLCPFRAALDRDMMLALVIAASAPVAAMVSMFAAKYGRDVDMSVGIVSGTTLLSVLTMPVVIALAMDIL